MKSSIPKILILLLIAVSLMATSSVEAKKRTAGSITLQFIPQESTGAEFPLLRDGITGIPVDLRFEDARPIPDLTVVGEGQTDDDSMYPVHATNDVGGFARDLLMRHAREWGVALSSDADRILKVKLTRFFVRESDKAVGSMYMASVGVAATLGNDDGAVLWDGGAAGGATRYGKSDSNENRNEVLSDAIKEAYAYLLGKTDLQRAWLGEEVQRREQVPAARTPAQDTPAMLLSEVVHLRDQGLSTDLLVAFIRQHEPTTAFSTDDVLEWKAAELPEEVIGAAMDLSRKDVSD